ncbi:MAG: trypsin-like peptidase domain-containing protein [Microthrixaceae bacterium]|nr:trypsin-like peptidase domain-containing protein [Microthrixaceae bacterium]
MPNENPEQPPVYSGASSQWRVPGPQAVSGPPAPGPVAGPPTSPPTTPHWTAGPPRSTTLPPTQTGSYPPVPPSGPPPFAQTLNGGPIPQPTPVPDATYAVTSKSGSIRSALIGALVGAVVAGLLVAAGLWDRPVATTTGAITNVTTQSRPTATIPGKSLDLRSILDKVGPSVVSIHTGSSRGEAAGSGVIINKDGLILTNAHVIEGASAINVEFIDGRSAQATLVGAVEARDVALIKVEGVSGLKAADLGSSSDLQVGDDVVAIGNALNLGDTPSVTTGIVSALGRSLQSPTGYLLTALIQTDAAINPGNSGGPLVNSAGQVVGINTAILADAQNIGFSLSIDSIKSIIEDVAAGREVNLERPLLGVESLDVAYLDSQVISRFEIDVTSGAFIQRVTADSGAEKAGLQAGDVVTEVDGRSIRSASDLTKRIGEKKPGDKVEISFERSGKSKTATATLGGQ